MNYNHTQHGRWHYILFVLALTTLVGALLVRSHPPLEATLAAIAGVFAFCGLIFFSLTVCDEGERLTLRFGPLPVFKTIRYTDITDVEVGRSTIIDGWGIHYIPGRGWTYNLWGFDCVKLTLGRKIIRIGTDDAENLANFLREKTGLSVVTHADGHL